MLPKITINFNMIYNSICFGPIFLILFFFLHICIGLCGLVARYFKNWTGPTGPIGSIKSQSGPVKTSQKPGLNWKLKKKTI